MYETTNDSRDARIAALEAQLETLKTNPHNFELSRICNTCGEPVEEGKKCVKHPNDVVNHFRRSTDTEKAETRADFVLVKQS